MNPKQVIVRAYDMGGYGDVAGAMRIASHLAHTGTPTRIEANCESTMEKLAVLQPDVPYCMPTGTPGSIEVDAMGYYKFEEAGQSAPHLFTEELDYSHDRRNDVPIYLRTGLARPWHETSGKGKPMFFRPLREWDFEKSDPRAAINKALSNAGSIGSLIEGIERISFAHLSPTLQRNGALPVLNHPYFKAADRAAQTYEGGQGIGLFLDAENEELLRYRLHKRRWNTISSDGEADIKDPSRLTLIFMGPQPQTTTTRLFLSSDAPNLVTGDLSLSDAMYGLIAMEGQGFFYETPHWKLPTYNALCEILSEHEEEAAIFRHASNDDFFVDSRRNDKAVRAAAADILGNTEHARTYTERMRESVRAEISSRFGEVQTSGQQQDGFFIKPGTPYLIQDATATALKELQEDEELQRHTERKREALNGNKQSPDPHLEIIAAN